ncbi:MAG: hypothetical protein AB1546_01485, partial [bacterium]
MEEIKTDFKIPKWWDCQWRRVGCGEISCPMCGRHIKRRQKHLEKGKDPDDLHNVLEDVADIFAETKEMLKKGIKKQGIELDDLPISDEDEAEPPERED